MLIRLQPVPRYGMAVRWVLLMQCGHYRITALHTQLGGPQELVGAVLACKWCRRLTLEPDPESMVIKVFPANPCAHE